MGNLLMALRLSDSNVRAAATDSLLECDSKVRDRRRAAAAARGPGGDTRISRVDSDDIESEWHSGCSDHRYTAVKARAAGVSVPMTCDPLTGGPSGPHRRCGPGRPRQPDSRPGSRPSPRPRRPWLRLTVTESD